MNLRWSRCWLLLAAAGLSGPACDARAEARQHGRAIQFSEPKSAEVTTNLSQLTSKKDGLKQLEDELNKSLQGFSSKSSLEGVMAPRFRPPPRPSPQNQRTKELLDRKKNWMFMSPEELLGTGSTTDDPFKTPEYGLDGKEKKMATPLERFYESLGPRAGAMGQGSSRDADVFGAGSRASGRDGTSDDSDLPSGLKASERELRKQLDSNTGPDFPALSPSRSTFGDFFGLGEQGISPEAISAHKAYMKQYQQLLDSSAVPANALDAFRATAPSRPPTGPANGLDAFAGTSRNGLGGSAAIFNPSLTPGTALDVNGQVLNQWNPLAPVSLPTVPKAPPPPTPNFDAPRRKF